MEDATDATSRPFRDIEVAEFEDTWLKLVGIHDTLAGFVWSPSKLWTDFSRKSQQQLLPTTSRVVSLFESSYMTSAVESWIEYRSFPLHRKCVVEDMQIVHPCNSCCTFVGYTTALDPRVKSIPLNAALVQPPEFQTLVAGDIGCLEGVEVGAIQTSACRVRHN